jgi:hypothetical protein
LHGQDGLFVDEKLHVYCAVHLKYVETEDRAVIALDDKAIELDTITEPVFSVALLIDPDQRRITDYAKPE